MTPTEQDSNGYGILKQRIYEEIAVIFAGKDLSHEQIAALMDDRKESVELIMRLITADRKRVALEAELQLLTYLLDERTENMFMQNPDTGEMTGNGWLCNTSLSAVSANRIEAERRKRIIELKAQQEEV